MSVQAHPRFARRRSTVREHRARRNLRRALWIVLVVIAVWSVAWVVQSPLFSVRTIDVTGAVRADVASVLTDENIYSGRPLVLIRSGRVAAALEADPWVKEASVHRRFPDQIDVRLVERVEVAVVKAEKGWRTVSDDGRIMLAVNEPSPHLARIDPRLAFAAAGGQRVSETMMAVVEFLAALPEPLIGQTTIATSGVELVADIAGHQVRLGTADNMAAKAAALAAVLADGRLASDAIIDLIAPARPAVSIPRRNSQPLLEVERGPLETLGAGQ